MVDGVYISFATDDCFLGAIVIEASDFGIAVMLAHALGINPGGEARGYELENVPQAYVDFYGGRLLSKEEVLAMPAPEAFEAPAGPCLTPPPLGRAGWRWRMGDMLTIAKAAADHLAVRGE